MRQLLLAAAVVAVAVLAGEAQEKKPAKIVKRDDKTKGKVTLKVGDTAPPVKAAKWLQGKEVTAFAKGKVYVVEFWATWCGPCIVMMPHMGELQAEYKDKGVTFIGFTAKDPNNSQEKVQAFVEKRGPKLGYTFAYADDRETYDAWMKAAGRDGIPCWFVVDKAGKIAYIGHPMYLDVVLPKVVAGKWTGADADDDEEGRGGDEGSGSRPASGRTPRAGLKALAEFEKKHPGHGRHPVLHAAEDRGDAQGRGKTDDAKSFCEALVKKSIKYDDVSALNTVARSLRRGEGQQGADGDRGQGDGGDGRHQQGHEVTHPREPEA